MAEPDLTQNRPMRVAGLKFPGALDERTSRSSRLQARPAVSRCQRRVTGPSRHSFSFSFSMAKRSSKPVVGLDIEPSAVAAAQVSVNGSISINRAAVVPLEPGIVRDGEVADVDGL